MAWPSTPNTTYIANSLPPIHAVDLNDFQSAINGIINSSFYLDAVVIDGIGGNVVTPINNTISVSNSLAGTTLPTPAYPGPGIAFVDLFPVCLASFESLLTMPITVGFTWGINVISVNRNSTGIYTIVINTTGFADPNNLCVITNVFSNDADVNLTIAGTTGGSLILAFKDLTGTLIDPPKTTLIGTTFYLMVFGS